MIITVHMQTYSCLTLLPLVMNNTLDRNLAFIPWGSMICSHICPVVKEINTFIHFTTWDTKIKLSRSMQRALFGSLLQSTLMIISVAIMTRPCLNGPVSSYICDQYPSLVVFMDGMENEAKRHEAERRRIRMKRAREQENPVGQITNTPEYITKAAHVCIFLRIKVRCARKEADPQVSYYAKLTKSIPVVGDSDELAYGLPKEVGILVIVKGFTHEWMKLLRK
jgi:hypothetical protein